jgi:hypothetical protein
VDKDTDWQQQISVRDVVSHTAASSSARLADHITRNNALLRRLGATPPKRRSWLRQAWSRLLNAWPLQWKRRSDQWGD